MTCTTKNVIYLISCNKCGIQYVVETGQALRNRMNNHRQRLKQMCNLFLYQHLMSYRIIIGVLSTPAAYAQVSPHRFVRCFGGRSGDTMENSEQKVANLRKAD